MYQVFCQFNFGSLTATHKLRLPCTKLTRKCKQARKTTILFTRASMFFRVALGRLLGLSIDVALGFWGSGVQLAWSWRCCCLRCGKLNQVLLKCILGLNTGAVASGYPLEQRCLRGPGSRHSVCNDGFCKVSGWPRLCRARLRDL